MKKLVVVLTALICSVTVISHSNSQNGKIEPAKAGAQLERENNVNRKTERSGTVDIIQLESERELKWMLSYVTPLMAILRKSNTTITRSSRRSVRSNKRNFYDLSFGNRNRNRFNRNDYYIDRDSYGYGGGGGYGGGYGGGGCCDKKDDLLPLLALLGLAGLLLYLIAIASTTAAGRRSNKRSVGEENNWILTDDYNIVLLDGPTWLSMVHELWEQDAALENTACTQETLCRMNRLAMAAPGQAGWAVSLSSLPLSYLLHTRHSGGFTSYVDASLMGRSGANCTELYLSCPRLSSF